MAVDSEKWKYIGSDMDNIKNILGLILIITVYVSVTDVFNTIVRVIRINIIIWIYDNNTPPGQYIR